MPSNSPDWPSKFGFEDLDVGTLIQANPKVFYAPAGLYRIVSKAQVPPTPPFSLFPSWRYKAISQSLPQIGEVSIDQIDISAVVPEKTP